MKRFKHTPRRSSPLLHYLNHFLDTNCSIGSELNLPIFRFPVLKICLKTGKLDRPVDTLRLTAFIMTQNLLFIFMLFLLRFPFHLQIEDFSDMSHVFTSKVTNYFLAVDSGVNY